MGTPGSQVLAPQGPDKGLRMKVLNQERRKSLRGAGGKGEGSDKSPPQPRPDPQTPSSHR